MVGPDIWLESSQSGIRDHSCAGSRHGAQESISAYSHRRQQALEVHLTHEPTKASKSRIKRLRGLHQPQYRLRVGDIRVFYDVTETQVQVLAIVTKAEAQAWLDTQGTPSQKTEGSSSGEGEG